MEFYPERPVSGHGTYNSHRKRYLFGIFVKAQETPLPRPGRRINIIYVGRKIALAVHHINVISLPASSDFCMAETESAHEKILPEIRAVPDILRISGSHGDFTAIIQFPAHFFRGQGSQQALCQLCPLRLGKVSLCQVPNQCLRQSPGHHNSFGGAVNPFKQALFPL